MNDKKQVWAAGYRTDVDYTPGLYPVLIPDHLLLKCALYGVQPPADIIASAPGARRLTYCELGFGQGMTLNFMAARDPDGTYIGVDNNPVHVANARAFAEAAGLANVQLIEENFAALLELDLPDFDVVVLHGIYSWITADIRENIIEFLRKKLKPGGLLYNSYNCAVGRHGDIPYRQLMIEIEKSLEGDAPQRVNTMLDVVDSIAEAGAGYFRANPTAQQRLKDLRRHSPAYVIHEYLGDSWKLYFFHEAAEEMERAKLTFIGSARIGQARVDLCLPADARKHLTRFNNPGTLELFKDIWHNQTFRQDLYVKGVTRLTPQKQVELMTPLRFGLARPRENCALQVPVPAGQATLPEDPYGKLLDALAGGIKTGGDLRAYMDRKPVGDAALIDALQVLIAVGHVNLMVAAESEAAIADGLKGFETAIDQEIEDGSQIFIVGAPLAGTAHQVSLIDYAFARAHRDGEKNAPKAVFEVLQARGQSLVKDGERVTDEAQAMAILKEQDKAFTNGLLPVLKMGGAV